MTSNLDIYRSAHTLTLQDITERKQTEEAMRKSEARLRDLFEHLPIGIWEEDYSAVKMMIDDLKGKGVLDVPLSYFFDDMPPLKEADASGLRGGVQESSAPDPTTDNPRNSRRTRVSARRPPKNREEDRAEEHASDRATSQRLCGGARRRAR